MADFLSGFLLGLVYGLLAIFNRPDLHVFLEETTTPTQAHQLQQEISAIEGVAVVTYVSQEEAYQEYKTSTQFNPELAELVTPDLLPASLEIHLETIEAEEKVRELLESNRLVDDVISGY